MTLVQPSGDIAAKIRGELREPDAETITKDVAAIREWLEKQPHLPKDMGNNSFKMQCVSHLISPLADDGRLRTFLRGCKFSLEKVKQKLDMYYTMRTAIPEFFTNRDIDRPELAEIMDIADMPPLPGLTPKGYRVSCLRAVDRENMPNNVADGMKLALMIGDIRLFEEKGEVVLIYSATINVNWANKHLPNLFLVGVGGDVYILDASVATPTHFAKFTPALVKKFLVCVQEAYPVKLKEVHVINISPLVDTIVSFVKPFLKEKIRERIHIHSNIEDLYKFVPKEMLPSEYGGNAGSIKDLNGIFFRFASLRWPINEIFSEQWRNKMKEYTQWFKEQENSKANESLRPGGARAVDDLFGMDGTFRQLSID